jgi:Bacterial self-protective colicin-like immunity
MKETINNSIYLYVKSKCLPLLQSFISGQIDGQEFEVEYLNLRRKYLELYIASPFYETLAAIFRDVDDFWYQYDEENSADLNDPYCIDEKELKRRCTIHYQKLMDLVKQYQPEA